MSAQSTTRRPTGQLAALCAVLLGLTAIRLWLVKVPLIPDEAGFYQVAQTWTLHGPNLYGHYFVDRPPGLIALFGLAALTGHIVAIRLVGLACALVFVVLVWWVVRRTGGAVLPAVVVAAALVGTPLNEAVYASGELFALPFVMGTVALLVLARDSRGLASYLWMAGAGLAGIAAMSVKQNFVDGLLFAGVLLVARVVRRELELRRALNLVAPLVAGVLAGVVAMGALAAATPAGLSGLWLAAVSFRSRATTVILSDNTAGTRNRIVEVLLVMVVTGAVPMLLALAGRAFRDRLRGPAWAWAIGVTAVAEVLSAVGGGSYWPHYALQLAPMAVLGTGLVWRRALAVRIVAALVVVSAVGSAVGFMVTRAHRPQDTSAIMGHWIRDASRPGDTAVVLYGHAEIQWATEMRSPYPFLWSLPTRTLDPHLGVLTSVVAGPHAPTWIMADNPVSSWNLDQSGAFRRALHRRYLSVGNVCGAQVWLRRQTPRQLTTPPRCDGLSVPPDWYLVKLGHWLTRP
ncbi:MAG: hypothetical protein M3130_03095 [Actinomycetota bacterium]|nr:hypothetical protein [Actinomycetota bacterium]